MTANSMIATILQREPQSMRECVAVWRQLGDILAQRGTQLSDAEIHRSLRALASLRSKVPENIRRDSALSVARHGRFAPLVALYANDVVPVAAAMLQNARLSDDDWLALLPATGDVARSILAGREDLSDAVRRALESLGAGSVALPPATLQSDWAQPEAFDQASSLANLVKDIASPEVEAASASDATTSEIGDDDPVQPVSQISELVRRIDRFQSTRLASVGAPPPKAEDMSAIEAEILAELKGSVAPARSVRQNLLQFRFETGADGIIFWAEGIAPQAVIGLTLAEAAYGHEPGSDGVAAGAFRQRAEIVNAHMRLSGSSETAGEWRLSADPIFDQATGQFRGYRGIARRPLRREKPYGQPVEAEAGDSIRQLIHELRSPLNAISGFAQIISGQMFGPVSGAYRAMAETIIEDAVTVQSIIEDLDAATGMAAHGPQPTEASDVIDLVDVFAFVSKDLQALLAEQRVGLSMTEEGGPFMARADVGNVRRMVGRLLTALIDVSEPDSLLVAQLIADITHDDMVQLRIVRPAAIRFADAQQLLDPGYSPEGEAPGADILSLGFSLRLVGSLAAANAGRLEIAQNALILHLPLATSDSRKQSGTQKAE